MNSSGKRRALSCGPLVDDACVRFETATPERVLRTAQEKKEKEERRFALVDGVCVSSRPQYQSGFENRSKPIS